MRLLNLSAIAVSCFLAGSAMQDDGPKFGFDDPQFRIDCDDWTTPRPSGLEYWERTNNLSMTMPEAIALSLAYADEKFDFDGVRTLSAELRLTKNPYYRMILLTHRFNEKKGRDICKRWEVQVGLTHKRVKTWMKLERFPGTPVNPEDVHEILPSGLQIWDVRIGEGRVVKPTSTVKVQYTMTLLDGTLVYNTYQDRDPKTFKVSDAPLQGFIDGLPGARQGCKRKLIIPPHLAYGKMGRGSTIPGDATVIYDIEILSVKN